MPIIGNPIYQSAFIVDQFSGDGTTTAFTMSVAPAGVSNVLVAVSGVLQDPSTYGVVGTTINFSTAPPSGTGNISCRYLGVPVTGVTTTAYRTVTEFTATASQTTFTPPSYTVGFINVYRNGVLLGSADYTATNGTTVVLATGATAGDLVTVESFQVSSVVNAIQNTAGSVGSNNIATDAVTASKMADSSVDLESATVTGILPEANGGTGTTTGYYGFKNRIFNGQMQIDQRNAGAIVSNANGYTLDRWYLLRGASSSSPVFNVQQSTTAPPNYTNSLLVTVGTSGAPGANNFSALYQVIEGFNVSDLGFGSATASAITLSFWVRSSLTGTFGVAFQNSAVDRSYIATYTISAANTWEQKTITIAGDTSGTWLTNNGAGLRVYWDLGVGTGQSTTAGSWQAGNFLGLAGGTKLSNTGSATLNITGVQLEKGSTATSFDYLDYGRQLQQCQRYYQLNIANSGYAVTTTSASINVAGEVTMRSAPTFSLVNGTSTLIDYGTAARNITAIGFITGSSTNGMMVDVTCSTTANAKPHALIGGAIGMTAEL
jgi:hypothetical protein